MKGYSNRDIQLDILKGIGILLVVFAHTCSSMASGKVYLFHMPLFFFLSGAAMSMSKNSDYRIGKRLYRIMVPYLVFSLISFVYWYFVESRFRPVHDGDIFPVLSGVLEMGWQQFLNIFLAFSFKDAFLYNVVLWFLPCLFMAIMIYTFVRRHMGHYEVAGVALIAIAGFLMCDVRLPFCLEIAFVAVPFLYLGRLLYRRICNVPIVVGGGILLLAAVLVWIFRPSVDMRIHSYGAWWLFYIVAISAILAMVIFSRMLVGREYGVLQWLGRNSLAIMCIHEPIKRVLLKMSEMMIGMEVSDIRQSIVLSIFIAALVVATCTPIVFFMRKYTPWCIGMK